MFNDKNNHRFSCPVCRQKKRAKADDLVCPDCYKIYVQEAGRALAQGSVLSLSQWVLPKAEVFLEESQEQLLQKQKAFKDLQEQVSDEAFKEIRRSTGGQFIEDKRVFTAGLDIKRKELWREKGGNRLFAEMKTLEEEVSFVQGITKGIQERNNHPSPRSNPGSNPGSVLKTRPEVKDDSAKPK